MDFYTSFPYSFKRFSPLILEPIFSIKRRDFQECFKSDFLEFSSTISILIFSHKHLSHPLLYLPIGICCERILGDQSVVITKDFHLCFEEADECVRGVSSSCVNSVFEVRPRRACGLAVCTG